MYLESSALKNVSIAEAVVTFPSGAHFYQNIFFYIYRRFTQFLYKLNCFVPNQKCSDCHWRASCRYYQMTGQNFRQYPCFLAERDIFAKSIYRPQEVLSFRFYFLGKYQDILYSYFRIFIEDYLHQSLSGSTFYLKSLSLVPYEEKMMRVDQMKFSSLIEDKNIEAVYRKMLAYYCSYYECSFDLKDEAWRYEFKSCKEISLGKHELSTYRLTMHGYLPRIRFQSAVDIPDIFSLIGIGKFNFVGGGHFET